MLITRSRTRLDGTSKGNKVRDKFYHFLYYWILKNLQSFFLWFTRLNSYNVLVPTLDSL